MSIYFSPNDGNTGIGQWRAYHSDGTSGGFLTPHQKSFPDNTANTVIKINYNGFVPGNKVTEAQAPVYTNDYAVNYDNGTGNVYSSSSVYSNCGSVSLTNPVITVIARVTFQQNGNNETLFNFIQDSGISFGLRRYGTTNQLEGFIYNSGTQILSVVGGNIVIGQSTSVAIQWDETAAPGFLDLFQDGLPINTSSSDAVSLIGTYTSTYLARSNDTMFTGYVYEFVCQNAYLSKFEIFASMKSFNGVPSFQVSTEGTVGIGGVADSPIYSKLKVYSDYSTKLSMYSANTTAPVYINFQTTSNACFVGMAGYYNQIYVDNLLGYEPGALALGTYQNNPIIFATNLGFGGAETMRITKDGKVGIGTSSPSASLSVQGNVYASNALTTTTVFATIYHGDGGLLSNISGAYGKHHEQPERLELGVWYCEQRLDLRKHAEQYPGFEYYSALCQPRRLKRRHDHERVCVRHDRRKQLDDRLSHNYRYQWGSIYQHL